MKKERNETQNGCGCYGEPFPYKTYDEILSEKNRRTRFRQGLAVVLWIFLAFSAGIVGIGMLLTRTFSVSKLLWGEGDGAAVPSVLVGQMSADGQETLPDAAGELSHRQVAALVNGARDWVVRVCGEVCGSGVVLWENGYILTASHLIGESGGITVSLRDGGEYSAFVVGDDLYTDLALIKIDAAGLTAAPIESRGSAQNTESAAVLGWPEECGELRAQPVTLREKGRTALRAGVIQTLYSTGGALRAGLSGGPVLSGDGTLLGVASSAILPGEDEGMMLPIDDVLSIAHALADKGYVAGRPALGLDVVRLPSGEAQMLPAGLLVEAVLPESDAASAGLRAGDVITHIGGYRVTTLAGGWRQRNDYSVGESIDLVWVRGGIRHAALIRLIDLHDAGPDFDF